LAELGAKSVAEVVGTLQVESASPRCNPCPS
jgi:hypothetical protein